jgi:hypothetical protein
MDEKMRPSLRVLAVVAAAVVIVGLIVLGLIGGFFAPA